MLNMKRETEKSFFIFDVSPFTFHKIFDTAQNKKI